MAKYLIDNNVISHYLSGRFSTATLEFLDPILDDIPNISVITEIEALSWVNEDKEKEAIMRSFIIESNIISLSRDVVTKCIEIRRSRKIRTPDAIIAATAIVYEFTLITSDNGFKGISGLEIINPYELSSS